LAGALLNPVSLVVAGLFFATAIAVAQILFYIF
jgi:preprotein translocase subunit Sec61beta